MHTSITLGRKLGCARDTCEKTWTGTTLPVGTHFGLWEKFWLAALPCFSLVVARNQLASGAPPTFRDFEADQFYNIQEGKDELGHQAIARIGKKE